MQKHKANNHTPTTHKISLKRVTAVINADMTVTHKCKQAAGSQGLSFPEQYLPSPKTNENKTGIISCKHNFDAWKKIHSQTKIKDFPQTMNQNWRITHAWGKKNKERLKWSICLTNARSLTIGCSPLVHRVQGKILLQENHNSNLSKSWFWLVSSWKFRVRWKLMFKRKINITLPDSTRLMFNLWITLFEHFGLEWLLSACRHVLVSDVCTWTWTLAQKFCCMVIL